MESDLKIAIIDGVQMSFIFEALKDYAKQVISYSSAEEALLKLSSDLPDVLILDLDMPRVNGLTVCNLLRKDPRFSDLPIVLVSGDKDDIGDFNLYFKGVDFMHKPINSIELINKIKLYHNLRSVYSTVARMYTTIGNIKGT